MSQVWFLDVPENRTIIEVASRAPAVTVARVGPYVSIRSDVQIVVDRRSTGVRHAVWYSCIAALSGSRVTQWDKDQLRVENR